MGVDEDVAYYRPGMVELPSPLSLPDGSLEPNSTAAFVEGVAYYLRRPDLRASISEEGHRLFKARRMAEVLRPAIALPELPLLSSERSETSSNVLQSTLADSDSPNR